MQLHICQSLKALKNPTLTKCTAKDQRPRIYHLAVSSFCFSSPRWPSTWSNLQSACELTLFSAKDQSSYYMDLKHNLNKLDSHKCIVPSSNGLKILHTMSFLHVRTLDCCKPLKSTSQRGHLVCFCHLHTGEITFQVNRPIERNTLESGFP